MVDRLESRINEGLEQIEIFDRYSEDEQLKLFQTWFPEEVFHGVQHIRAVLVNSSFGSFSVWERLESMDVLPLNTYILGALLKKCPALLDLKPAVWAFVKEIQDSSKAILKEKHFKVGSHAITQDNYELSGEIPQWTKEIAAHL